MVNLGGLQYVFSLFYSLKTSFKVIHNFTSFEIYVHVSSTLLGHQHPKDQGPLFSMLYFFQKQLRSPQDMSSLWCHYSTM